MLKKRLIFTLLVRDGVIQLSRNFSLQAVGDIHWLYGHYRFDSIAYSVDELVLLNVEREMKRTANFTAFVAALGRKCFMPIAAGGGIGCPADAYRLLDAGADKLVINSALFQAPSLVMELAKTFGSQCIVGSVDYKRTGASTEVFTANGTVSTGLSVQGAIERAAGLGVGEVYLTSMDRDGTGHGYDLPVLSEAVRHCQVPIIASGGVGEYEDFVSGMQIEGVTGASTANIFNFIGEGLAVARSHVAAKAIPLAEWSFDQLPGRQAWDEDAIQGSKLG